MTKEAALHRFFNSFGIPAYTESSVPDDAEYSFPYLTYVAPTTAWEGGDKSITVNLWYCSEDEAPVNAKAREISRQICGRNVSLPCDGGYIWIKGPPTVEPITDEGNQNIKRRYINITAEFLTQY